MQWEVVFVKLGNTKKHLCGHVSEAFRYDVKRLVEIVPFFNNLKLVWSIHKTAPTCMPIMHY